MRASARSPTARAWYLLVACKPIAKGAIIEAHYKPYSGILLHTFIEASFVC